MSDVAYPNSATETDDCPICGESPRAAAGLWVCACDYEETEDSNESLGVESPGVYNEGGTR